MLLVLLPVLQCCTAAIPDAARRWTVTDNIQAAPQRKYSTHECFNTAGDGLLGEKVVCLLHNVCYDPQASPHSLLYFEDPEAVRLMGTGAPKHFNNGTLYEFPEFFSCGKNRTVVQSTRAPFPTQFTWMTPAVYAVACPVNCAYFSHQWLDNVFPYFHAAQVLPTRPMGAGEGGYHSPLRGAGPFWSTCFQLLPSNRFVTASGSCFCRCSGNNPAASSLPSSAPLPPPPLVQ